MQLSKARDQSAKRRWTKHNGTMVMTIRIGEPLRTRFKEHCERTGAAPATVIRVALSAYLDAGAPEPAKVDHLTDKELWAAVMQRKMLG